MPFFNGVNLFGFQVKMATDGIERNVQRNEYMGTDGVEELDGGFRQMFTRCSGRLVGTSDDGGANALNSAIATFRSYLDGNSYTLVDSFGNAWNNVKLVEFQLDQEMGIKQTATGDYFQLYRATFSHLSRT